MDELTKNMDKTLPAAKFGETVLQGVSDSFSDYWIQGRFFNLHTRKRYWYWFVFRVEGKGRRYRFRRMYRRETLSKYCAEMCADRLAFELGVEIAEERGG